jgi:hypothetical protein
MFASGGREVQMIITKSGNKLAEVIEKAIAKSAITMAEYEEIMTVAGQDGVTDHHEQALLKQLNGLIANRTIIFEKSP